MNHINLVDEEPHLVAVVSGLSKAKRVAVDIESNGFFRYHERICLVQFTSGETAFINDPLPIDNVRPLGDLLADRSVEKVFHDGGYDLRSFDRDWGFRVNNLFDTRIADAFIGSERLGLQSVVEEYTGVALAKHRKLQRSDWTMRPLSFEALQYAANDVLHLLKVRNALSARLKKLSRLSWAQEEFKRMQNVRYIHPNRKLAFLMIKGSRDLDRRGLAILRSLFEFREREAIRLDHPVFKVIPDFALIKLSAEPEADPSTVKGLGRFGRPPANRRLKNAIDEGTRARPVVRQKRMRIKETWTPEERMSARTRLRSLNEWRRELGRELLLDPGLLWPTESLERLARHPCALHAELSSPVIRDWQKREFGEALRKVVVSWG